MTKYKCVYRGKTLEVIAPDARAAQLEAAIQFRARKSWQVFVREVK